MMIPEEFQIDSLPELDAAKVRSFCNLYVDDLYFQYQFGHFIFAAYASVPAALTPDLLYKLWQNFNQYTWMGNPVTIHRVAVADVLLSPMCSEVGFELYEMSDPIRLAFQRWLKVSHDDKDGLWKERGLHSVREISGFVEQYYWVPNAATQRWGTAYTEHQINEAMANTDPARYFSVLQDKLYFAAGEHRESDILRVLDTLGNTIKRWRHLQGANLSNALRQLQEQTGWMDALKSLLKRNDEAFQEQLDSDTSLLTRISDNDEGSAIHIPVQITGIDQSIRKASPDRKIRTLIVATGHSHTLKSREQPGLHSATLFAETLEKCLEAGQLETTMLCDREATLSGILEAWGNLMEACTDKDDIILYIAAEGAREGDHCLARTADAHALWDNNISYIAKSGKYHSITVILQLDYAGTTNWLDSKDPRHIVFASCGLEQPAESMYVLGESQQPVCAFTYAMCTAMRMNPSLRMSNRDLFQSALTTYDQIDLLPKEGSGQVKATIWDTKAPRLIGSEQAKDQFFLRGPNFIIRLQTALFNVGLLDKPLTGKRDADTLRVLEQYRKEKSLPEKTDFKEYLSLLEDEPARTHPAILLFIFCDRPEQRLQIEREHQTIKNMFESQRHDASRWKIEFMVNAPLNKVMDFILRQEHRGRIQMIYYGGIDDNGRWSFPQDAIGIPELSGVIDHQRNIQLIVSNTCRSKLFSQYAVMFGAKSAIGFEGVVDDTTAVQFAEVVVGWMLYEDERAMSTFEAYVDKRISFKGDRARGTVRHPLRIYMSDNSFRLTWNFKEENVQTDVREEGEFRANAQAKNLSRGVVVKDDLQKHRWGGETARNGYSLNGEVEDGQFKYYHVTITVEAQDPKTYGEVAFFLHDTFTPQVRFARFKSGRAWVRLSAVYESFTVGAMLEDGTTLELDLNEVEGYPPGFYYPRDRFKSTVEELYAARPIKVKKDLQKNRWSGKSESNNKRLTAAVTPRVVPGAYKVVPMVSSVDDVSLTGDVAFFVHDSFSKEVQYARAVNGQASITLIAYEDFTIGAYTQDGTMLELDLSEVEGYPPGFYAVPASKRTVKKDAEATGKAQVKKSPTKPSSNAPGKKK